MWLIKQKNKKLVAVIVINLTKTCVGSLRAYKRNKYMTALFGTQSAENTNRHMSFKKGTIFLFGFGIS